MVIMAIVMMAMVMVMVMVMMAVMVIVPKALSQVGWLPTSKLPQT
jgi:hypothetical protein